MVAEEVNRFEGSDFAAASFAITSANRIAAVLCPLEHLFWAASQIHIVLAFLAKCIDSYVAVGPRIISRGAQAGQIAPRTPAHDQTTIGGGRFSYLVASRL